MDNHNKIKISYLILIELKHIIATQRFYMIKNNCVYYYMDYSGLQCD